MSQRTPYTAEGFAHDLDYRFDVYRPSHEAMLRDLAGSAIDEREFMRLATTAGINLHTPDAKSVHPFEMHWWDVELPTHVLLVAAANTNARAGLDSYWAFTKSDREIAEMLTKGYEENERKRNT